MDPRELPRRGRRGFVAIVLLIASLAAGCGGNGASTGQSGLARGREIFQGGANGRTPCALCHTLRAAVASGPFGPDLDEVFRTDSNAYGLTREGLKELVVKQVTHPVCRDPLNANRCMPSDLAAGGDLDAVAEFVSKCADNVAAPGCRPVVVAGPMGAAKKGLGLYQRLGCIGCHWANGSATPVGPRLEGLSGSRVQLTNGKAVVADDSYVLTSILAPDAATVKGFPRGVMSSRIQAEHITAAQAQALVAYIKTLK
jgi:cytochrome c oxidase subunit 2